MMDYIIETKNLTKQYGTAKSVNSLNIHVRKGRIYGLLGRNGAGKTSTMKMLLGLTKPTVGDVMIFGKSLAGNEKSILPHIGSLIESPGFYPNLTGAENLQIFAALRGISDKSKVKDSLELVSLPYRDKKLYSQYSLGMKQRLAIALAVMHDPELLILDEPTNGLDPAGMKQIRDLMKNLCTEYGITIMISTHILSEIEPIADTVGVIHHGRMKKEISMKEIEQMSLAYIELSVPDQKRAAYVLSEKLGLTNFRILEERQIRIYDPQASTEQLSRVLAQNGVPVTALGKKSETLEDYFLKMTGEVSGGC